LCSRTTRGRTTKESRSRLGGDLAVAAERQRSSDLPAGWLSLLVEATADVCGWPTTSAPLVEHVGAVDAGLIARQRRWLATIATLDRAIRLHDAVRR
jgi:hypothetical protein